MKITENIKYIGVNDRKTDLFEGQYIIPNGIAYNSYVIIDSKIAVFDTVDVNFIEEWFKNITDAIDGRTPDYLIVHHMEPDHSAGIKAFAERYPHAKIISSAASFRMMKQFFNDDFLSRQIVVKDGDRIELGNHVLNVVSAPMVHWPEVIMTYESTQKVLFSADAFGKFGALDADEDWACEARRYYFGIVGKYGAQVQNLFKKLAGFEIDKICPLHGPILSENIQYYLNIYNIWSSYEAETDGILISYTSVYGNTKKAVMLLAEMLKALGCPKVAVNDLARCDMAEAVEDAFRYSKHVFATTSYNGDVFPFMREFINHLLERNYQNRKVAFVENGSWAPVAKKVMKSMLENSKDITFVDTSVTILSALNHESELQLKELAKELCKDYQ